MHTLIRADVKYRLAHIRFMIVIYRFSKTFPRLKVMMVIKNILFNEWKMNELCRP